MKFETVNPYKGNDFVDLVSQNCTDRLKHRLIIHFASVEDLVKNKVRTEVNNIVLEKNLTLVERIVREINNEMVRKLMKGLGGSSV